MTFAKQVSDRVAKRVAKDDWWAALHDRTAPALRVRQTLGAIVLLAVCCFAPIYAPIHAAPDSNHALPDVTFRTSQDETVRATDMKGDVVFVYLWATDCEACFAMRSAVERLNKQFGVRGVRFLSVNEDGEQQTWKDYMVHNPSAFIEVWDKNHSFRSKMHLTHLSTALITDRSGRIRWRSRWTADAEAKASAQLAGLLQEPSPK